MPAPESGNQYWTIFGSVEKETAKAYLWKLADSDMRPFWMPKSQCKDIAFDPNEDGDLTIKVKEWILKEKGVHPNDWYSEEELKNMEAAPSQEKTFDLDASPWDAVEDDDIPF